ncbi:hypothetical protein JKP88DRAFT_241072 [Tribonema minus]|uniref:Uncharacterized protein n=1 Tax=Tribonema minus TaxID=303371 RepID=A0A835Z5F6_9STRA|nr:hypothetical protein JKP88DRAFT_241072 [Tribonema minus]
MARKSTRTNAYPTVKPLQDIFASRPSGVTMIGPDRHVWQSSYHDGLPHHTSDNSGNMPFLKPEGIDPRNYVNKYIVGPNQKLLMGYKDSQGQYGWREEKNVMSENTVGFKLPASEEVPASLDANAIDDKGIALNIFVGAVASYRRADALPVYWDGECFFDIEKNELYVPESFKRGIPTTYGLKGTVYIPQETYLEDLLIPIEDQELSFPTEYHAQNTYDSIDVKSDGRHKKTNRKVGSQNAKECFESAWEQAVFEIEDIFTMPGAPYRERRTILETFIKPLKDAYKQIRLIPTMPIHSREWAMSAYENTPPNAYLVLTDPDSVFEGAVDPKERAPPRRRRTLDQKEFAGPLVGWKLDGSGKLEGVVVEGTSTVNKSAIVVHPGQLWVGDATKDNATIATVRRRMNQDISGIKKARETYGIKIPSEFINRMVKAYEDDFEAQTRSLQAIDKPVTSQRARAARAIRNLMGYSIGKGKPIRTEYGGVEVDLALLKFIVNWTTTDLTKDAAGGKHDFFSIIDELTEQLAKFVHECGEKIDPGARDIVVDATTINTAAIAAAPTTATNYVKKIWDAMTDKEKTSLVDGLLKYNTHNPDAWGYWKKIAKEEAGTIATGADRIKNPVMPIITGNVILAMLSSDDDPIYPMTAQKIEDLFAVDVPEYTPKTAGGDKVVMNTGDIDMKKARAFRQITLEIVGRLIQSIKPDPLFVYRDASKDPKNLLEWSTAQTVYFQRSFPYGALIHFKVVKGDFIDESTKDDDSYAMTKVTVV